MDTKALRQKILDLAICGKLAPQDPNDEPASVLLERIRREKKKMVEEGKLKPKDIKKDTIIFKGEDNLHYEKFQDGTVKCIEDEIPFEVPEGWAWCKLKHICMMAAGKSKPSDQIKAEPFVESYPCFGGNGIRGYLDEYNQDGTFSIIGRQGALCGNINIASGKFYATEHAVVTTLFYGIDFNWSNYTLEALQLNKYATGAAQPGLSVANILNVFVPVPPTQEQKRIGKKIVESIKIIETIEQEKMDLQTIVVNTKSKILDLSIRGKLVSQHPNDEPASALLEHIRAEKEELIKQGKIKRNKKECIIFKGDDNSYYQQTGTLIENLNEWDLEDIPNNWELCCLGELCDYGNCTNVDANNIADDAWILELEDIEKDTGRILQKIKKANRDSTSTKHLFHKGQVLYSKLRPYLNKVVIADEDGFCTSEILPLDFSTVVESQYALYYLMSPTFLKYANRCSYGVKMPRLGTADGKKAVFPLPPLKEQQRIVQYISAIFAKMDTIVNALT